MSGTKNKWEDTLDSFETPFKGGNEASWQAIQEKIGTSETPVFSMLDRKKKINFWPYSIAAILVIGLSVFFISGTENYEALSEDLNFKPTENSSVFLLKGSELKVKEKRGKTHNFLNGSAVFQINKGTNFIVETTKGTISVLGTEFSVEEYENTLVIKCSEGTVKFENELFSEMLAKGEGLKIENNNILKQKIDPAEINSMKKGVFFFHDMLFSEVINKLEKTYAIEIDLNPKFLSKRYTGNFHANDLSATLELVASPFGLKYQINQKKVEFFE